MTGRVVLLVPNIERDLPGRALLAYHLNRHGFGATFATGRRLEELLLATKPDVLVIEHLEWDYRANLARFAKSIGVKVVLLPTAGFFQEEDQESHLRIAGLRTGASSLLDGYLAWGGGIGELLAREGVLAPEKIHVVGSPRFDWYAPPLLDCGLSREAFAKKVGLPVSWRRPLVLWTPTNLTISRTDASGLRRWSQSTGTPEATIRMYLDDALEQHRVQSELFLSLARRHPNWTLLIKVHPSDRFDEYRAIAGQSSNIRVCEGVTIVDALRHSDVVLQRYSTSVCEAWMLGKPVLAVEIGQYRIRLADSFRSGCEVVRNEEEARSAIARYARDPTIPAEQAHARDRHLESFFFRIDGRSAERCAAVIGMIARQARTENQAGVGVKKARHILSGGWKNRLGPANLLRAILRMREDRLVRFWRPSRVSRPATVQPELVEPLYALFERVLSNRSPGGVSPLPLSEQVPVCARGGVDSADER